MWKEIIQELLMAGLTQGQIAERVQVTQTHISDLLHEKRGKRLGFEIGSRLIALHKEVCVNAREKEAGDGRLLLS